MNIFWEITSFGHFLYCYRQFRVIRKEFQRLIVVSMQNSICVPFAEYIGRSVL